MRGLRRSKVEENTDLDLAPMLSMIVALIPILLLSFSFFHLKTAEALLPVPSKGKNKEMLKDKKRLIVTVDRRRKLKIKMMRGNAVVYSKNIKAVKSGKGRKRNLSVLYKEILKIKKKNPQMTRLEMIFQEDAVYEEVIALMDQLRKVKNSEDEVRFVDPVSKEKKTTDLLFPHIVFADIFGA